MTTIYNPYQALQDQLTASKGVVNQNNAMTHGNTTTPLGTQTFTSRVDPATGATVWDQTQTLSPEQQQLYNQQTAQQTALGQTGMGLTGQIASAYGSPLDLSGLPQVYGANDLLGARQQAQDAIYGRQTQYLDPQFQHLGDSLETRLVNQGINKGSAAYDREMANYADQRQKAYSDARQAAITGGTNELTTLANLSGTQRQNALAEMLTARNEPLKEWTALQSGTAPTMPTFSNPQTSTINQPDMMSAILQANQMQNANDQMSAANRNALLSGLFGLGSSYLQGGGAKTLTDLYSKYFGNGNAALDEYTPTVQQQPVPDASTADLPYGSAVTAAAPAYEALTAPAAAAAAPAAAAPAAGGAGFGAAGGGTAEAANAAMAAEAAGTGAGIGGGLAGLGAIEAGANAAALGAGSGLAGAGSALYSATPALSIGSTAAGAGAAEGAAGGAAAGTGMSGLAATGWGALAAAVAAIAANNTKAHVNHASEPLPGQEYVNRGDGNGMIAQGNVALGAGNDRSTGSGQFFIKNPQTGEWTWTGKDGSTLMGKLFAKDFEGWSQDQAKAYTDFLANQGYTGTYGQPLPPGMEYAQAAYNQQMKDNIPQRIQQYYGQLGGEQGTGMSFADFLAAASQLGITITGNVWG